LRDVAGVQVVRHTRRRRTIEEVRQDLVAVRVVHPAVDGEVGRSALTGDGGRGGASARSRRERATEARRRIRDGRAAGRRRAVRVLEATGVELLAVLDPRPLQPIAAERAGWRPLRAEASRTAELALVADRDDVTDRVAVPARRITRLSRLNKAVAANDR